MGRAWHDLYWHGENLARLCRSYQTLYEKAEKIDDQGMMQIWGEALRKVTMNCQDIAKTVLQVEAIVKGHERNYNKQHDDH